MMRRGWFQESYRHYLAAKGVSTGRYRAAKTGGGRLVERLFQDSAERERAVVASAPDVARAQLSLRRVQVPVREAAKMEEAAAVERLLQKAGRDVYGERAAKGRATVARQKQQALKSLPPLRAAPFWKPEYSQPVVMNLEGQIAAVKRRKEALEKDIAAEQEFAAKDVLRRELVSEDESLVKLEKRKEFVTGLLNKAKLQEPLTPKEGAELGRHVLAYQQVS